MIKNEREYRITKSQAAKFRQTLDGLQRRTGGPVGVHPRIAQAQIDAVSSQLADLESELRDYESLQNGDFQIERLEIVDELPMLLIKARIACRLSQKELAERLGLKEQQIQQYEATDYVSASFRRLREVAHALSVQSGSGRRLSA